MKKLFGGINLTWKKLIIFSILAGVYTALMAILPITKDTSFRDIAIQLEWWILFGTIIICNSKSPKDSALKCFIFFLISQPLIYLLQVPFSWQGWNLFKYYGYWFKLTVLTLPMAFIGYYIKNNNILSVIIMLPILLILAFLGLGYLNSAIENFPHHLLSFIFCFVEIIIIVLNLYDKTKLRILAFGVIILFIIGYILLKGGIGNSEFETIKSLNDFSSNEEITVTTFTATRKGNVKLIKTDEAYNARLNGVKGGKYTFEITDEEGNIYSYEYHYDKEQKTIVLNKIN